MPLTAQVSNPEIARRLPAAVVSPVVLALLLFAGTIGLYFRALGGGFVNYDDPAYVTANAHVLRGLSWSNVVWAFTTTAEANWHPLTWISHMADVELFGMNPRGHHAVNVVLHALNVVLLFLILQQATGLALPSAMVAALFAVHPLNVECVAWVAERKSLLSMLFLLLALAAYSGYRNNRTYGRYALVFVVFALALAAKPMAVTLPILLLFWDYWPLARTSSGPAGSDNQAAVLWRAVEKIPLLILSAASSCMTLYAERSGGALGTVEALPLGTRINNAIYSYAAYIGKAIWPSRLAVFYPHPEGSLPAWRVLAAALLIAGITGLAWRYRKQRRYLLVGWLWYLVALAPMIGVVQVGRQAMADRYAYLPLVGLFVIAGWAGAELCARWPLSNFMRSALLAAPLLAYASVTFLQISYWHDSYRLFSHALAVTSRNGIAEDNLGAALVEMGRSDLAWPHFRAAVEYIPELSTAHYNLGVLEQQQGHPELAESEYRLALNYTTDPTEIAQAHSNLGFLLMGRSLWTAAEDEFTAALRVNPNKQNSLLGRGMAEYQQSNFDAAARDLTRAAQIAPSAPANFWLGMTLEAKSQPLAAEAAYEAALRLAPGMIEAQQRLDALRSKP
jgi:protein O-mannosyl-transferase